MMQHMKFKFSILFWILGLHTILAQEVFVTSPYLQIGHHPSPQSLQLLWHAADVNAVWSVEHRNLSTDTWTRSENISFNRVAVTGITPHRVYHAALTGLIPGSRFTYRVIKDSKLVFTAEAQAAKSFDQPYRFVAFGDIGAETAGQKQLATRVFLSRPDFVVVPGDIVYSYGLISEYRKKFWPVYNADQADTAGAPIMRSIPFIAAVGNHDADSRDLDKRPDALAYYMFWEQPLNGPAGKEGGAIVPFLRGAEANKKAFLEAAGDAYPRMTNYSFDYGNAHWTVIDSDTYVDWTDKEITDWVAKDLADAKEATWHFVMFHHPGFNSSKAHYEEQHMRLLSPVFEKGNVDVVFNGHVHNYQRSFPLRFVPDKEAVAIVGDKAQRKKIVYGKWTLDKKFDGKKNTSPQGIIYLVTGAGGQRLYNPEQHNVPDSWQKFTDKFISDVHSITIADVDGKKLTIRQVDANGKELDVFKISKK